MSTYCFVKVPENHIVIDFDIKDSNDNKSLEKNYEQGVHLHYTYKENKQ